MTREEAINIVRNIYQTDAEKEALQALIPELKDSEDERIIRFFTELATDACGGPGQEYYEEFGLNYDKVMTWLGKHKDASKAIKAVDRIDKYIDENVANAHDMKDSNPDKKYYRGWDDALGKMAGILQDVYSDEKQKEQKPIKVEVYEVGKGTTICGQDYKCKKDYKEGNCWYIKDVIYHCGRDGYLTDQNGVSWSCTPEWFNEYIYTNSEWADKEKNDFVSGQFSQFIQCKLSFDEFKEGEHYWLEYIGDDMYVGRSDNILNQKFHITPRQLYTLFSQQLEEKQKGEKPVPINPDDKHMLERIMALVDFCNDKEIIWSWLCEKVKVAAQKSVEWDKLQEDFRNINEAFENGKKEVINRPEAFGLQKPMYALTKDQYVEKFRSLCDSYEIKLPNRAYDIYHLCDDLAKLFGNANKQE